MITEQLLRELLDADFEVYISSGSDYELRIIGEIYHPTEFQELIKRITELGWEFVCVTAENDEVVTLFEMRK